MTIKQLQELGYTTITTIYKGQLNCCACGCGGDYPYDLKNDARDNKVLSEAMDLLNEYEWNDIIDLGKATENELEDKDNFGMYFENGEISPYNDKEGQEVNISLITKTYIKNEGDDWNEEYIQEGIRIYLRKDNK